MVRSAVAIAGAVLAAGMFPAAASLAADKGVVDTHSDFGVTLEGPDSSSVGGRATYEMQISSAGPTARR